MADIRQMDAKEVEIRAAQLEELIEFNIREARAAEHTAYIAGAHYTYLDKMRAHRYATADLEHFHLSLLMYKESSRRLHALRDRIELEMNEKYPENAPAKESL